MKLQEAENVEGSKLVKDTSTTSERAAKCRGAFTRNNTHVETFSKHLQSLDMDSPEVKAKDKSEDHIDEVDESSDEEGWDFL
ncbi:hypothetical protein ILUMI_13197 [Ignelater luminosus]|uniref:Uncharacterized protein n=1 Tax=Ignelater luminosus TaxID=2038154 RepID=A0A8K0CX46_IGNLU|nr:hypothetical protein ILUMI_13197 [Ignelater luminosus]